MKLQLIALSVVLANFNLTSVVLDGTPQDVSQAERNSLNIANQIPCGQSGSPQPSDIRLPVYINQSMVFNGAIYDSHGSTGNISATMKIGHNPVFDPAVPDTVGFYFPPYTNVGQLQANQTQISWSLPQNFFLLLITPQVPLNFTIQFRYNTGPLSFYQCLDLELTPATSGSSLVKGSLWLAIVAALIVIKL